MHARGPVGVEQLTSFKYRVRGSGPDAACDAHTCRRFYPVASAQRHSRRCRMSRRAWPSACSAARSTRRMPVMRWSPRSRMRRLALDQLWWMVTPGNPLKSTRELAPLAERIARSRSHHATTRASRSPPSRRRITSATPPTRWRWCKRAQSGRRFRLDHGRRQSARFPPLAALAPDRHDLPDRRHRPAGRDAVLPVVGGRQDLRLCARRRGRRAAAGAHEGAGLDLHPRPALVAVVERHPGGRRR